MTAIERWAARRRCRREKADMEFLARYGDRKTDDHERARKLVLAMCSETRLAELRLEVAARIKEAGDDD